MASHADCDHPSTRAARAACRRARAGGDTLEVTLIGREAVGRTGSQAVADGEERDNYGQTPSDPAKACMTCGVERISMHGADRMTGRDLYVGPKCAWRIPEVDRRPVDW